mmetsp:Transcript_39420/g.45257  ORF Transcript_39420/g.45257 Transcript_39420/m.45257 type:complete len:126 (+) Transcript_39420:197-574(+)
MHLLLTITLNSIGSNERTSSESISSTRRDRPILKARNRSSYYLYPEVPSHREIKKRTQQENIYYKENTMCNCSKMESISETPNQKKFYNFEEFVEIMKDRMIIERDRTHQDNGEVIFESQVKNVS